MQKEEEQRKREADEMKVIVFDISMLLTYNPPLNPLPGNIFLFSFSFQAKMENAKQEQGNSITQMFDRLKVGLMKQEVL